MLSVDEIHLEMLKGLDIVGLSQLTDHFDVAWRSRTVPLDCLTGVVVHIFKKGDHRVCSNYQGVTQLSFPEKACASELETRH